MINFFLYLIDALKVFYNIWSVKIARHDYTTASLKKTTNDYYFTLINLQQLTFQGGKSPSLNPNEEELLFLRYIPKEKKTAIFNLNLKESKNQEIKLSHKYSHLYLDVAWINSNEFIYSNVNKDSNANGLLDRGDKATIHSVLIEDQEQNQYKERQLLDKKFIIDNIGFSQFSDGVIFYTGEEKGKNEIYLMKDSGFMPKEKH